jgi:hypothetical protein
VEALATQHSPASAGQFWLPSYFTTWRGASLVMADQNLVRLHEDSPTASPHLLGREKTFVPVADDVVTLRYGRTYEFRVRLVDLTRGGPDWNAQHPEPPGTSIASIAFKRRKRPGPIAIVARPGDVDPAPPTPRSIVIAKPRLGYPEATFTGQATFEDVRQDALALQAVDPKKRQEASVFDPDVVAVAIRVDVKALSGDRAEFFRLYETTREMPADMLTIDLDFQDVPTLLAFSSSQPDDGPLALPSAREVRLTLVAMGRTDEGYFADEASREGEPAVMFLRAEAELEPVLLVDAPLPSTVLRSFFFQPPVDDLAPRPEARLAAELDLEHAGLTLTGAARRRTVIGAAATLRHTLSPERSALTVASSADLVQRWINVLHLKLMRDWTWDGLHEEGIEVWRTISRAGMPDAAQLAGTIRLPHAIAPKVVAGVSADPRAVVRQWTDLYFFDAIDPKPASGKVPTELTVDYEVRVTFKQAPTPASLTRSIRLPLTTPPVQVPRLISAGIALSPYEQADDYSSTSQRRRVLWFELAESPLDRDDDYFIRVLAGAPDPLLLDFGAPPLPETIEPPLPIDPEPIRMITPGQPKDDSGLNAMQQLEESPRAKRHYIIPLPDDLSDISPELFGFFVYEVRLGHTDVRWSTAQGRFGPALRVSGVQHPAPPLICQAARSTTDILARAPFATPVHQGRNLRPRQLRTRLWSLLYARVRQVDTAEWRNVLIARARMLRPEHVEHGDDARELFGEGRFALAVVSDLLARLGLPADTPLTVLAAEVFGDPPIDEPLGGELGRGRLLRISPLVPVPDAC